MFFNAFLALALRTLLVLENRKLDKKFGTLVEQDTRDAVAASAEIKAEATAGGEDYGPRYRFVL